MTASALKALKAPKAGIQQVGLTIICAQSARKGSPLGGHHFPRSRAPKGAREVFQQFHRVSSFRAFSAFRA
jgi:hypothetical protein